MPSHDAPEAFGPARDRVAKRPVIYIAGPYRGPSESQVWANIQAAREAAMLVWRCGGIALCPHLNSMLMGGSAADRAFLEGGLVLLSRCDAVLVLDGWMGSEGSRVERACAIQWGMPVLPLRCARQERDEDLDRLRTYISAYQVGKECVL